MKTIVYATATLIVTVTACHKEKKEAKVFGCTDPTAYNYNSSANIDDGTCQYCPIPLGICTSSDTALARQKILGKWYLRRTSHSYPYSTDSYCYTGPPDYLEFLSNRTVNIHDSSGSVKTIVYEFNYDSGRIYDKFRILDSISSAKEYIRVCDSSFYIERSINAGSLYYYYYVKE